ncbi:MAG: periplasmic heavy metal sensor [Myxococcales bacterium]|nr:periplasmic heavy metal sensor [Myxococcales bacterium]
MLTILFLCLSTAIASPFEPHPPGAPDLGDNSGGGRHGDDRGENLMKNFSKLSERLGISAEQKAAIEKLYFDNKTAGIDLKAKSDKARLDMERVMMAPTVDEKAALKAFDAAGSAEIEVRRNDLKLMLGIRKTLTAEQWTQLDSMRDAAKENRRERRKDQRDGRDGDGEKDGD